MNVTKKCLITGKQGFDSLGNKFAILEVNAKNGDIIKLNKISETKYNEIWSAYEYPKHDEHPIIDTENKIIVVGGELKESKRTICVIGK